MSANSSADTDKDEKLKVGWVYKLSKEQLIVELNKRDIEFGQSDNFDSLRKTLVDAVKAEILAETLKKNVSESEESKQQQTKPIDNSGTEDSFYSVSDSDEENDMSGNHALDFCLEKDDWEIFVERLEIRFQLKKTKDTDKAAELLSRLDEEAYKLLKSLCAPLKLTDSTYDELVKVMTNHLKPKPSELMERCTFNQAKQTPSESVADFAARLKKLALNCGFSDLQESLRDQFAIGLRDEETRISLFKVDKLTFDAALKEAIAREAAVKNASSAVNTLDKRNTQKDVFALKQGNKSESAYNNRKPPGTQRYGASKKHGSQQQRPQNQNKSDIVCYCCGGRNHVRSECRYKDKTCNHCGGKGHLERACLKKNGAPRKSVNKLEESSQAAEEEEKEREPKHYRDFFNMKTEDERMYKSVCVGNECARAEPMYVNVVVNGKNISMEIDTGTYATVISEVEKDKYFRDEIMIKSNINLHTYDNRVMHTLGQIKNLKAEFNGKKCNLYCYVMSGDGPMLIGRQWLAAFGCWPLQIRNININSSLNKLKIDDMSDYFFKKYKVLFSDEPGLYNKSKTKIYLKEGARPIAMKCRPVAHAMRLLIENELDRLVGLDHVEPVEASEWATPIVPTFKSNGNLRICGDFKLTLNPSIIIDKYPLHTIDEIFACMQGGCYFTELDMFHCYMQFPVHEDCLDLLTIVTHKGLYRYKKIPEGVSPAPADVQRKMDECLRGIDGVIAYIDNIYIMGRTKEENIARTEKVCERLIECGLKLNKKCKFMQERIEVLGFVIDKDGLHKAKSKVDAMVKAPQPTNFKELNSFLGLINFYARFLKDRSDNLKPLYDCANASEFVWDESCDKAFAWVKNELISPRVLANYDPNEQIVLACDASSYGLSAILSHKYKDSTEKPIAYASQKISKKELNRTILDKEAMAIIFGFKRFFQFIFGKEIILRTDNQPLQLILGPRKGIPATANARLQRYAYYLSGFRYKVEYIKSKANANCDALSRLPIEDNTELPEEDFSPVYFFENGINLMDGKMLAHESKVDKTVCNVIKYTLNGWPDVKELTDNEKLYYSKRLELNIDKGCLFWGLRAIIPESMQSRVLKELHASHMGIVKIKMLARSYVWWPGIDKDIENFVNNCTTCLVEQKKPQQTPLTTWPWPDRVWHRLHCDFLGPLYGDMYLVVIDAHSKWPEVINFKNNTKAYRLIEVFKALFARYGLPVHMVTDGGPQFRADEFLEFLRQNGINHSFSPPYHPATNGAAENFVGTFKNKVTKIVKGGETPESAVNLFLSDYRNIEHCTTGKSPAQLMYKRDLRTRFDLLKTTVAANVEKKQRAQIVAKAGSRQNNVNVGDTVLIDNHRVRGEKRVTGEVIKKVSPSTFVVKDCNDALAKRHIDQIVKPRRSPRLHKS